MRKTYKIEIDPNKEQIKVLIKSCGAARFAYNWGLAKCIETREKGFKKPSAIDLHKILVKEKNEGELGWLKEVTKCAPQEALRDLDNAYKNFFNGLKGKKKRGFPKFKRRKEGLGGYAVNNPSKVEDGYIKFPSLGWIKLKERDYIPNGIYSCARVKQKYGRWFITISVEFEPEQYANKDMPVVGVDLGVKTLAVCSNGTIVNLPRKTAQFQRKLRRSQKSISRSQPKSKSRKKKIFRYGRLWEKVTNKKKDLIHKFTTQLTRKSSTIGIENLNVSGMMKNHRLAGAISNNSFYEVRRQLEYKASWYGSKIILVDRFYPSTKMCSNCGAIKDMPLSLRVYECSNCGISIDRDLNAAKNLAASCAERANECGDGSSGLGKSERNFCL